MIKHTILVLLSLCCLTAVAQAPDSLGSVAGAGTLLGQDCRLMLNGYGQAHYEHSFANGDNSGDFQVKRAILIGNALIGKHLRAMLMVDAAATAANRHLHEYYMEYTFSPAAKLRMGQYKQPFMYENLLIPTLFGALNMTEGTRYMAGIAGDGMQGNMVGRDMGVMLSGDLFHRADGKPLTDYSIGLFNGCGLNQRDNNKAKDLIGMINVYPRKEWLITSSFIIGRGHALAASPYGDIAAGQNYRRNRWSIGSQWKDRQLMLRTEATFGRNGSTVSRAVYAEAWLTICRGLDLVLNYDHLNRNTALSRAQQQSYSSYTVSNNYTCGLQYWLRHQCRVAAQYVYQHHATTPDTQQIITQVQFAF